MMKKFLLIFVFIIVAGAILGVLFFWNQVNMPASSSDEEFLFTVSEGEDVKEIAARLVELELVRSQFWFETYVYFDRSETEFITGTFGVRPNMDIREITSILTAGETAPDRWIQVTEGLTSKKIAKDLEVQGIISADDFIAAASVTDTREILPDNQYAVLRDKPSDQSLEGYLFPDSYRIFKDATAVDIIERMLNNLESKFTSQMREDAASGNMSVFEIITLASIIEKEVSIEWDDGGVLINNDHYIVAGIFYDRLNMGVALQSDATVNYVTDKGKLQPSFDDLEVDNPYNTYKYRGLPPGPISNPSLEAIKAAIYPEQTDYFYFLHRVNDDGSIVFSKTYDEHLENKAKYLQ